MYMLILGLIILFLKIWGVGFVGNWSWLVVMTPFAMTWAWWTWSDWSGYTQQKEKEKECLKNKKRRAKIKEGLRPYGNEAYSARRKNIEESRVWDSHPERELADKKKPENK